MPLGSRHEEVGMILADGPAIVLRRDDGGVWRLDGPGALSECVGRRVTIAGVRSGFDLLEVEAVDGRAVHRAWIMSWELGLGVLATLTTLAGMVFSIAGR